MAKPTPKNPAIRKMQSAIIGVPDITQTIQDDVCAHCGKPAVEFKNEISRREYAITGLCQPCQDSAFAALEDLEEDEDVLPGGYDEVE